jgi:hypothetical protein
MSAIEYRYIINGSIDLREDAIMKKGKILLWLILSTVLSACTAGNVTTGISTDVGSSAATSSTRLPSRLPTETVDESTPTSFPTIIPVNTPTEGPPPDLELLNTTIYYNDSGGGTLIGEIRNNTNAPIVFPIDPLYKKDTAHPILQVTTEAWDWHGWQMGSHYYHEIRIGKGTIDSPNTNCFLYPGETGPIIIRSVSDCRYNSENCVNIKEEIKEAPEGTGMRLVGYEDLKTYTPWPGLYPDYHPQVENLVYSVADYGIEFSFDVQKDFFKGYDYRYTAWVFLYDKTGGLISVLHRSQIEKIFQEKDGMYHISGYSNSTSPYSPQEFRNSNERMGKLAWRNFAQIDHVRVFVESAHLFLCTEYADYDHYRQVMNGD